MSGMVRPPLTKELGLLLEDTPPCRQLLSLLTFLPHHNAQRPTQPPDAVLEKLALLVAEQLVAVASEGFPQNRALNLVSQRGLQYTLLGHRVASLWSGPRGAPTPPGPFYLTP